MSHWLYNSWGSEWEAGAHSDQGWGTLKQRGPGSRTAALAPGEVMRPLQSSSNYISDTHFHQQTTDTNCLFLDWKSLFLSTQVVRLEHVEHQQLHGHPQRDSSNNLPSTFPLMVEKYQSVLLYCSREDLEKLSQYLPTGCAQLQCWAAAHFAPLCFTDPPQLPAECSPMFGDSGLQISGRV